MINCANGEKDITHDKIGAKLGISIITIIYILYIIFIIGVIIINKKRTKSVRSEPGFVSKLIHYVKELPQPSFSNSTKIEDSFTGRFSDWFSKVENSINSGSVLAILAAGIVIGFNSLIMTPLIATMFPVDISQPIEIPGRHVKINPGQFFIALIGFILSLILFFFIAELIYTIKKYFKHTLTISILILLFIFLTIMLIWNGIQVDDLLNKPDCVSVGASHSLSSSNPSLSTPSTQFGIFGA